MSNISVFTANGSSVHGAMPSLCYTRSSSSKSMKKIQRQEKSRQKAMGLTNFSLTRFSHFRQKCKIDFSPCARCSE